MLAKITKSGFGLAENNGVSPSGKATDSDSVIREFKSLYPSQEEIIRTMKEIHGSYYFLRKNILASSFAEFHIFKEILREAVIVVITKRVRLSLNVKVVDFVQI